MGEAYLQIHWQVEVVVLALVLADHLEERLLLELVGDVPDHNSGPLLLVFKYAVNVDVICQFLLFRSRCLFLFWRFQLRRLNT